MFCLDVLKPGGHFVCKFYQGPDDKQFEKNLKKVFRRVFRSKPESSRKVTALPLHNGHKLTALQESKECFFVAKELKKGVSKKDLVQEQTVEEFYDPLKDDQYDLPEDEFTIQTPKVDKKN